MIPTTALLLIAILAAILVAAHALHQRGAAASSIPPPRAPGARRAQPEIATARLEQRAPVPLAADASGPVLLEWDAPSADRAAAADGADGRLRAKIRDRYITARFPGVFRGSADLEETEQVIKVARLYFEEEKFDRALELLQLATAQSPGDKALRLAQLEIVFLTRDAGLFTELAHAFLASHPASAEWDDVARLGRAVAPKEALFGASPGGPAHEHYGPWPDMPNWIQASWDLTSEVLAADFHRAMASRKGGNP